MSTGHGNSVEGMLKRLESMYLMALPLSIDAIRSQIAEGIDIMIHLEKQISGKRQVVEISELSDYADGRFILNTLFRMNGEGKLERLGESKLNHTRKVLLKGGNYADRLQKTGII